MFGRGPRPPQQDSRAPQEKPQQPERRWTKFDKNVPLPKIGEELTPAQRANVLYLTEEPFQELHGSLGLRAPSLNDLGQLHTFAGLNLFGPGEKGSPEQRQWEEYIKTIAGHGMTRWPTPKHTEILARLLEGEPLQGDTAALAGSLYMDAWDTGDFLIVGKSGKELVGAGGKIEPAAVIVNGRGLAYIPALQARFPTIPFISAVQPGDTFRAKLRAACGG